MDHGKIDDVEKYMYLTGHFDDHTGATMQYDVHLPIEAVHGYTGSYRCRHWASICTVLPRRPPWSSILAKKCVVVLWNCCSKLGWQWWDLCLSAPPLKRQTFLTVANMSNISFRHVGDILFCRHFFWLLALCRWDLLLTHTLVCT